MWVICPWVNWILWEVFMCFSVTSGSREIPPTLDCVQEPHHHRMTPARATRGCRAKVAPATTCLGAWLWKVEEKQV